MQSSLHRSFRLFFGSLFLTALATAGDPPVPPPAKHGAQDLINQLIQHQNAAPKPDKTRPTVEGYKPLDQAAPHRVVVRLAAGADTQTFLARAAAQGGVASNLKLL